MLVWASAAVAAPDAIIAKARAYLGSEEALNAVRSLRYAGTVETVEKQADGSEKPASYAIEIIFQKDYQQRITLTKDDLIETTALDDYEAWHRIQDKRDATRWRTVLFQKNRIKQLRASTLENLTFFRGIEKVGGQVVDHGVVPIDGKNAHKVGFVHEPGIVYVRYFDPETGKLLFTETDQGVRIREEGEFTVNGIRFPKRIINMTTLPDGTERVVTIAITEVAVNQNFPADMFRVPPPK
jgi:hypothetical protein